MISDDSSSTLYVFKLIYKYITDGIFLILCDMNKKLTHSYVFTTVFILIECIQLLTFHFPLIGLDELRASFGWSHAWIDWLSYIINALQVTPYLITSSNSGNILNIVSSVSIVLIFTFIFLCILLYWIKNEKLTYRLPSLILKTYSQLIFSILYIPILNSLFLQVPCIGIDNNGLGCWSGNHVIIASISVIAGILFIMFGLLIELTVFSRDPTSDSALSAPHKHPQTYLFLWKSIYCVLFSIFYTTPKAHWGLMVALLLGNVSSTLYFYLRLPFYNWSINLLKCSCLGVVSWSSIMLLVNFSYSSSSIPFAYFMFIPFVIIGMLFAVNYRKLYFQHCTIRDCVNPYEYELKVRFHIEEVTLYMIKKKLDFGLYLKLDDSAMHVGYSFESLPSNHDETNDSRMQIKQRHEKLLAEGEAIYTHALRRIPTSLMILFKAYHNSCYSINPALAQHALIKAESKNPSGDEFFSIQLIRALYNETTDVYQKDIISFIAWQKNQDLARLEDENATRNQLAFWNELILAKPDLNRLQELTVKINLSISICQDAFNKLLKLNDSSTQVLRMYSSFLDDVLNQPEKALSLAKKADELEETQARMHRDSSEVTLLDDRSAVISISGDKDHLGDILNVNNGVVNLFGYSLHELLGGNIIRLMPPPYTVHHTSFLQNYFNTGVSGILNTNRYIFGLHKSGYLIPIDLFVREIANSTVLEGAAANGNKSVSDSNSNSSTFVGIIKGTDLSNVNALSLQIEDNKLENIIGKVSKKSKSKRKKAGVNLDEIYADQIVQTTPEFATLDPSLCMVSCTQGFAALLGLEMYEIRGGNVKIDKYIEEFRILFEEGMQEPIGIGANVVTLSHGHIPMNITIQRMNVKTSYYYLLQINLPVQYSTSVIKKFSSDEVHNFNSKSEVVINTEIEEENETTENSHMLPKRSKSFPSNVLEANTIEMVSPLISKNISRASKSDKDDNSQTPSHDSGNNSRASSTSNSNSLNNLNMRIQSFSKSSDQSVLGSGLKKLQYILLFGLFLLTATSLVKYFYVTSLLSKVQMVAKDVVVVSNAATTLSKISFDSALLSNVYLTPTLQFFDTEEGNEARDRLATSLGDFEITIDYIFSTSKYSFSQELYDYSFTPNIPMLVQRNVDGVFDLKTENLRLYDALSLLASKCRTILSKDFIDMNDAQDDIFYVNYNIPQVLISRLERVIELRILQANSSIDDLQKISLALTIASILLISCLIVFVIKPVIWSIDENKLSILVLFTEIPKNYLASFKKKCDERLIRLIRARDDILNVGFSIDDELADDTNINEDEQIIDEKVGNVIDVDIANNQSASKSSNLTSSVYVEDRYINLSKISLILVISIIYFVVTYSIEYLSLSSFLSTVPHNIEYGAHAKVSRRLAFAFLVKLATQNITQAIGAYSPNMYVVDSALVSSYIKKTEHFESILSYGDDSLSVLKPTGIQLEYYFGKTCLPIGFYTPPDGCDSFYSGAVAHGIHNAIATTLDMMKITLLEVTLFSNYTDFYQINATLNSANMHALQTMFITYLPPLAAASDLQYEADLNYQVDNANQIRFILLVAFIFSAFFLYLIYFAPLLWTLNNEQKRTINLLFLIPSVVMEKMSSIRAFVEKLANETQSG